MFGVRGSPGNTINHATSYRGNHCKAGLVEAVDVVSGIGYDKVDPDNPASLRFVNVYQVSNLGVFDFGALDHHAGGILRARRRRHLVRGTHEPSRPGCPPTNCTDRAVIDPEVVAGQATIMIKSAFLSPQAGGAPNIASSPASGGSHRIVGGGCCVRR